MRYSVSGIPGGGNLRSRPVSYRRTPRGLRPWDASAWNPGTGYHLTQFKLVPISDTEADASVDEAKLVELGDGELVDRDFVDEVEEVVEMTRTELVQVGNLAGHKGQEKK